MQTREKLKLLLEAYRMIHPRNEIKANDKRAEHNSPGRFFKELIAMCDFPPIKKLQ